MLRLGSNRNGNNVSSFTHGCACHVSRTTRAQAENVAVSAGLAAVTAGLCNCVEGV